MPFNLHNFCLLALKMFVLAKIDLNDNFSRLNQAEREQLKFALKSSLSLKVLTNKRSQRIQNLKEDLARSIACIYVHVSLFDLLIILVDIR